MQVLNSLCSFILKYSKQRFIHLVELENGYQNGHFQVLAGSNYFQDSFAVLFW